MKIKPLLFSFITIFLLVGCSLTTTLSTGEPTPTTAIQPVQATEAATAVEAAPPTAVPPTEVPPTEIPPTAAPEPTDTPEPALPERVFTNGLAIDVPEMVASGFYVTVVPAETGEEFFSYPEYRSLNFTGYRLLGTFHNPRIEVYPIDEFAQLNQYAGKAANDLRALLASGQAQSGQRMPFLPVFNAAQMFTAQPKFLTFANGTGVRYLSQYGQALYPVSNEMLFYTFQGITSDGKYYVTAILPEGAAWLPDGSDPNDPQPPDGIPFPDLESPDIENEANAYFTAVRTRLDQTPGNQFTVPLPLLDEMIASLEVREP